ncbi:MAG: hypothetical protein QM648_02860 [Solirubrobacterales bacterium]
MNRFAKQFLIPVVVVALAALVVAGCGSKSSSSSESPDAALKAALDKTAGIKSGKADVSGAVSLGSVPGSIDISGTGVFDTEASGGGAMNITIGINVAGSQQEIGFVSVDGQSYLVSGDKGVKQGKNDSGATSPDQIASFIKALGENATNVKKTGANTYTATIDVKKMFQESDKASGGKLSDLKIPGLGSSTDLAKSLGSTDITVTVDSEGYASKLDLNMTLKTGNTTGGLRLNIALSEINQPQTIEKPKNIVSSTAELGGLGSALSGQ